MEHNPQQRVRPESIAARNFSDDLDSLFGLNSGSTLGNLSFTVEEKKRNVSTREEELAAIEARLQEAEQRLARAAGNPQQPTNGTSDPSYQAASGAQPSYPPRDPASRQGSGYQPYREQPSQYQAQPMSRPPNPREESFRPHIPGAMPRTPTPKFGSGNDYVTVDRTR